MIPAELNQGRAVQWTEDSDLAWSTVKARSSQGGCGSTPCLEWVPVPENITVQGMIQSLTPQLRP